MGGEEKKSNSFHSKESADRYSGITDMRKKEERIQPCFSFEDRSHVTLPSMSNFSAYQKIIQEQMMHEHKTHDMIFPALITSTRVPKVKKVIDNGCLFFGDQNADDDEDDAADVATADEDDDEASFSCVAGFSCGPGCGHEHDVGIGGKL